MNWDVYQRGDRFGTDNVADSQQTANRQLTPNKNVKKEKNAIINYSRVTHEESSEYYQLALALHEGIRLNHTGYRKPDFGKWTSDMRRIVENDQRATEQVQHSITWSQQHHFWRTVILSTAALRRNWDQMVAQMKHERDRRKGQVHQLPRRRVEEFVSDLTKGEAWHYSETISSYNALLFN